MGKLSFRYRINPKPGHMNAAFRYDYENLTEYGLAYQRNAALSDASIFNSPVGITKIAAGLSDLRSLFTVTRTDKEASNRDNFEPVIHRHGLASKDGYGALVHKVRDDMKFYKEVYASGYSYLTGNKFELLFGSTDTIFSSELPIYFAKGDSIRMEIRHDILVSGETNYANMFPDRICSGDEKRGEYYDFSRISSPRTGQSEYENVYVKSPGPEFEILKDIFGWTDKPEFEIIYQMPASTPRPIGNANETENAAKGEYKGFITNFVPIPQRELIANYPYKLISSKTTRYSGKFESFIPSIIKDRVAEVFETDLCSKPIPKADVYDMLSSPSDDKITYDMDGLFYNVKSKGKTGYFFNPDTFGIQETKYAIYTEDLHGKQHELIAFIEPDYDMFGNKDSSMNAHVFDKVDAGVFNKYASVYQSVSASGDNGTASVSDSVHAAGGISDVLTTRTLIPIKYTKNGRKVKTNSNVFFSKDNTMLVYFQKHAFGFKTSFNVAENSNDAYFQKFRNGMFVKDKFVGGLKSARDVYRNRDGSFFSKILLEADDFRCKEFAYKSRTDIEFIDSGYFIHRLPYDLMEIQKENWQVFKNPHDFEIMAKGIWSYTHMDVKFDVSDDVPPKHENAMMNSVIFVHRVVKNMQTGNMIVPFSKLNNRAIIDHINEMVWKGAHDTSWLINQDMWATVMPKPTWVDDSIPWFDKAPVQTYIDYQNHWLTKVKLKSMISNSLPSGNKNGKEAHTFRDNWVSKYAKYSDIYEPPIHAIKTPKYSDLFKDEWIRRDASKELHYPFTNEWLNKIVQINYYSYGLMADKDRRRDISILNNESAHREPKDIVLDFNSPVTRDSSIRTWFDEYLFTDRNIKDFSIGEPIEWLEKTRKKLGLHPDDVGNWAWVYETPDPLEPFFGIDELLLPENDTRYENLKEIIFDKERMRPRNPVKIIDDTTFIAKYPIAHPSKNHFTDLAVDYDASAYKWENYYGVRTDIMYTCFLKYYRIWEVKMFEFSTMTMQQAVNQMLEYMYAWMVDYFSLEDLEGAFRVLRLIRWYGESAIIQNSQYLISYEYGILESKLTSGKCLVPNNLDENDTMFVDASKGVIRNNPAYIRNGPAYVEFYIDNKKNTTFTFSLSNSVGSVNIYINDELVDQRPFTAKNITYPLDTTGDTNIIRIEKPAAHNLNDTFYIGNIKVPDCGFKDLSIEFDPKLRAGNKPLDVVAKKMIKFAQLHENRDEVYDMMFKANLGVNEVYKRLLEYWELHHANKTKGKRLTIKKC